MVRHTLRIVIMAVALWMPAGHAEAGPYEDGLAAKQRGDYATMLKLWRKLAKKGNAQAQYSLGQVYDLGVGVSENDVTAVKYFRLAAKQHHADAQYELGRLYYYGWGVAKDYPAALNWYRKAALQGHSQAQRDVAHLLSIGTGGVEQDVATAIKWNLLAAGQGNENAQYSLGYSYYFGSSIGKLQKDLVQSYKWFSVAADRGYEDAARMRDKLAAMMPPEDVAKAKALASEWQPKTWDELKGQTPEEPK